MGRWYQAQRSDEPRCGGSVAIAGQDVTTHDFRASFTSSLLRHLSAARRLDDPDGVNADAGRDF